MCHVQIAREHSAVERRSSPVGFVLRISWACTCFSCLLQLEPPWTWMDSCRRVNFCLRIAKTSWPCRAMVQNEYLLGKQPKILGYVGLRLWTPSSELCLKIGSLFYVAHLLWQRKLPLLVWAVVSTEQRLLGLNKLNFKHRRKGRILRPARVLRENLRLCGWHFKKTFGCPWSELVFGIMTQLCQKKIWINVCCQNTWSAPVFFCTGLRATDRWRATWRPQCCVWMGRNFLSGPRRPQWRRMDRPQANDEKRSRVGNPQLRGGGERLAVIRLVISLNMIRVKSVKKNIGSICLHARQRIPFIVPSVKTCSVIQNIDAKQLKTRATWFSCPLSPHSMRFSNRSRRDSCVRRSSHVAAASLVDHSSLLEFLENKLDAWPSAAHTPGNVYVMSSRPSDWCASRTCIASGSRRFSFGKRTNVPGSRQLKLLWLGAQNFAQKYSGCDSFETINKKRLHLQSGCGPVREKNTCLPRETNVRDIIMTSTDHRLCQQTAPCRPCRNILRSAVSATIQMRPCVKLNLHGLRLAAEWLHVSQSVKCLRFDKDVLFEVAKTEAAEGMPPHDPFR